MSDGYFGFICVALVGAIQAINPSASVNIVAKVMNECEKSLPRDQKCTIIAVPPSKD